MTTDQLIDATAFMFGVGRQELFSSSRVARIAEARQALAWALRQNNWSLKSMGAFLHRDHTTIIYAVKTMEHRAMHSPHFAERLNVLAQQVVPPLDLAARIVELERRVAELEAK